MPISTQEAKERELGRERGRERENVSFSLLVFLVCSEHVQIFLMSFKICIFDRYQKLSGKKVYMYV